MNEFSANSIECYNTVYNTYIRKNVSVAETVIITYEKDCNKKLLQRTEYEKQNIRMEALIYRVLG